MSVDLGMVKPGKTIYVPFNTFDSNDPSASVAIAALVVGDIEVYKDGGTTQRASDSGYTLLDTDGIDFDGHVGIGGFSIDLSDNSTAGFWAAGARYFVVVGPVTVDAAVVNFVSTTFEIGYLGAILDTTIASLTSATQFILTSGPAEADVLIGCPVLIHDVASAVQFAFGVVSDYIVTTKEVFLATTPVGFTPVATDNISFFMPTDLYSSRGTVQTAGDIAALVVTADAAIDTLATTVGVAGAGLTDVGGMSTGMKAEVQVEADASLVTYAGPTKAEMDTAHALLATPAQVLTNVIQGLKNTGLVLTLSTIETVTDQTNFIIPATDDAVDNDAYNDLTAVFIDGSDPNQVSIRSVIDYIASTRSVEVDKAPDFTITTADTLIILSSSGSRAIMNTLLTGSTFNIATSLGRRIREIEAAFVVASGIAQAGGANTITLEAGSSSTNNIFNGDRITIVSGTGIGEHGLVIGYVGGTLVATMSENWVIQPDSTSGYEISPATVDIHTWAHNSVSASASGLPDVNVNEVGDTSQTAGDLAALIVIIDTVVDAIKAVTDLLPDAGALSDLAVILLDTADMQPKLGTPIGAGISEDVAAVKAETVLIVADTGELQTDWANGGRLDLILDAILIDTATTIPGLISALNDLAASDILTTALVESYNADGSPPTLTQALMLIMQTLTEFAISGTTITWKKLDGSTTAGTGTLDNATNPTSLTRAT